ncbi:MAG: hypothetical protein OEQ24_10345 [Gammaproteobacteria bacterium]|nr:hypothetical protein [Gammaproteobacteria bacterium]
MKRSLLILCLAIISLSIQSVNAAPPDNVGPPTTQNVRIIEQPIDVNVDNDATNPVPITDAFVRTLFQATLNVNLPSGSNNNNPGATIYSVPAGSRAVIENVAIVAFIPEPDVQYPGVGIRTTINFTAAEHIIGPKYVSTPLSLAEPSQHFNFSESLRLYADPQTDIVIRFLRHGLNFNGLAPFSATISGYLVPENSPSLSP